MTGDSRLSSGDAAMTELSNLSSRRAAAITETLHAGRRLRGGEQAPHFVVARLVERVVPEADGLKRLRHRQAFDCVGETAEPLAGIARADGHGHNDRRGSLLTQCENRRPHGRSGCQTVDHAGGDSRIARIAARMVDPVASPSSTRMMWRS